MKKIILSILFGLVCIFIIGFLCTIFKVLFIGGYFFSPLNGEGAENALEKNEEKIYEVINYFVNSGYTNIYIPSSMEKGIMSIDGNIAKIEDSEVIKSIEYLKKQGYDVIGKEENTIYFQIWSNLDSGRGIAFSIDENEPTLQFLTKLEKLKKDNWYYYEEDFNEWKLRYGTQGD